MSSIETIEYIVLTMTIVGGIIGWCANLTMRNWQKMCESSLAKSQDTLANFYWPLYQKLSYIYKYPNVSHINQGTYKEIIEILETSYGRAVPRKRLSISLMKVYLKLKIIVDTKDMLQLDSPSSASEPHAPGATASSKHTHENYTKSSESIEYLNSFNKENIEKLNFKIENCLPSLQSTLFKLSKKTQILLGERKRKDIICGGCVVSACIQDSFPVCRWCCKKHEEETLSDLDTPTGAPDLDINLFRSENDDGVDDSV